MNPKGWTYGAELELADLDRAKPLPLGCGWDVRDFSMVNSDGIAVDPKGKLHDRGGEINTAPNKTVAEQVAQFRMIMKWYPEAAVNYRSNLHIHVRVPGLSEDLHALKRLQKLTHRYLPEVLKVLEPIPRPNIFAYPTEALMAGALKRFHRRRVSHQTFLTPQRLMQQQHTNTVQAFLEAEVPRSKAGAVMWHAQPRCCVNIRQLRETDTIEFRHFPGTLSAQEFEAALVWCRDYLRGMLGKREYRPMAQYQRMIREGYKFPLFQPYDHRMEQRYLLTCHDGTVPRDQLVKNIERIKREDSRRLSRQRK